MIVLIPAYQPDHRLVQICSDLARYRIVVVDDGSGSAYTEVFEAARQAGAEVIRLDHNRGKGFALKTGFAHIAARHPGQDVVCADSDGQHRPADIAAVASRVAVTEAAMVLGVRRFTGNVPARSRFGNTATRVLFRLVTGRSVTDTQTGLRGYPSWVLNWLGATPGDRFEYELRLLLRAVREGLAIEEVEIATVYLDGNRSSHFRPLQDSVRIYRPLLGSIFAFAGSSLLAFAADAALLAVFVTASGHLIASAVAARLVSATLNYTVNRRTVFGPLAPHRYAAPRYAALALVSLVANVLLLRALAGTFGSLPVAKLLTELSLFAAGFVVQRAFVFARTHRTTPRPQLALTVAAGATRQP
ncbi:glycosyltransferase involved in cell wall biosynthesis [Actinoplanes lutulentus]|uniref:Glycosyltransferase involved in cell wall biosynthesis n=1 Tax=Actinoplanes lutulentus TaxID=1287878 RepID=A0A327ZPY3_9ACTN|nr:glycosyltransferase [Actinoplanes lutulentus]MBB2943959.1 glycosyltransferase involved in cell wall biosynthesis [Actinoplanes lutulentus]RAK42808.1 glycosyltransferase involved in cell wall biosynthesis [Actinoplanes lutulentus]